MDEIGDRIRGALLGLAAGDRIGGPTAMALRLLEGVVARGGFDAGETRRRYLDWHRAEGFDAALAAALAFAGPSNYAPVTAGTLAGARFGARAIATARIAPVHDKAELERMAGALVAMAARDRAPGA